MATLEIDTDVGIVEIKTQWEDYTKGISLDGPWVKINYVVEPWIKTDPVMRALAGIGQNLAPHLCPVAYGLRVVDTSCVGVGEKPDDEGIPNFELGIVTATYGITRVDFDGPDQPPGDPEMYFPNEIAPGEPFLYMEHALEFSKEIVKVPGTCLRYYSDLKPCITPVTRSLAVADFTVIRHYQSKVPYLDFVEYMDTLNHATFFGQDRGTMKFVNGRSRRTFNSDGSSAQMVELHFQWRRAGHNRVFRPDTMKHDHVIDNVGDFLYTHKDLRNLIGDTLPAQAAGPDIFGLVDG